MAISEPKTDDYSIKTNARQKRPYQGVEECIKPGRNLYGMKKYNSRPRSPFSALQTGALKRSDVIEIRAIVHEP
jgi:hypothetical protein